jgi:hypothetical protein
LPSFSTPGFGKQKPRPPVSTALHTHSSNEAIDISSPGTTSPNSACSIPHKRSSSDLAPAPPNPPKRPRIAPYFDKENVSSALRKGKEREGYSPTPSQRYTCYAPDISSNAAPSSSSVRPQTAQSSRRIPAAPRHFTYSYKVHSDLQDVIFVLSLIVSC